MKFETIADASAAIRAGRATPVDLVEQCLGQIERWEKNVRAWVLVDAEGARQQAQRMTDEIKKGIYRGPLHGIPVGIKDIFDIADWPTAAGSKRWANSIARQDAPVVARVRRAGAIFLGKTVTTQFASFDPPVTRNPWNLARTPGGSSSGSAAALATGMCLGALGSQTGGSITRPATFCGVAGLKPTYGLLPLDGIVALAPSMDHPGPMARCVEDLAILLDALAAGESGLSGPGFVDDYTAGLKESEGPPRLGTVRGLFEDLAEPGVREKMAEVESKLEEAGAVIDAVGLPAGFRDVIQQHRVIMCVESAQYHEERFRKHPDDYDPKIRSLIEEGFRFSATEYGRAKEAQAELQREMESLWPDVDALLVPATTGPAPGADTTGNPAFNSPWSFTGLPAASSPTGQFIDGLPIGVQWIGPRFGERDLLGVARWCERALGVKPVEPH